jgi:multiple sugar transport system permease protein
MKKNNFFDGETSGYIFILPALIFMIIFIGYPIIYNLILSFQNVNVFTFSDKNKPLIGFENFISLFKNSILNLTILNTLIYTICCITFQFIFGFLLAIFFNKKFFLSEKLRAFIMIAWLIPITITGLLFKFMFSTSGGIFNEALLYFHLINKPIEWLLQPITAMISLIITNIWIGVPFNMILILTGLTTIPDEIY